MNKNDTIFCIKDYLYVKAGESVIITSIDKTSDGSLISFSRNGTDYLNGPAIFSDWFSEYFLTKREVRKKKIQKIEKS